MSDTALITRRDVEFDDAGTTLRGWLYSPARGASPYPAVALAHGFSGVKEIDLDRYARAFSSAGLVALAYDHPCFGASDGLPRLEADPQRQVQGYSSALTYLSALPEVDATRLGVWGTSYSGGHVVAAAASDSRIRCVVAQVPYVGLEGADSLDSPLAAEDEPAGAPRMVPVVPPAPGGFGVLAADGAGDWFLNRARAAPTWRNEVTLRSLGMLARYRPLDDAPRLRDAALLVIAAEQDTLTPADSARALHARAGEPKRLVVVPGGHFAVYDAEFDTACAAAREWFVEHLVTANRSSRVMDG